MRWTDKRWDRVEKAYLALTEGKGRYSDSSAAAITYAYEHGETDEFVIPTVIVDENQQPTAKIENNDAVIYFNFRADRAESLPGHSQMMNLTDLNDPVESWICVLSP